MKTRHWDRHKNGGLTFTELGLGTAPLGNLYQAISEEQAQDTFQTAWDIGVRYFDTAPLYGLGLAERRLGHFLISKPRDEYVLSTKVGRLLKASAPDQRTGIGKWFDVPARQEVYDYSFDGVMRSFEFSLERLGVDRIDLLLAHDLDVFNHGSTEKRDHYINAFMEGGYKACMALRDQGVIKAIGAGINEWPAAQILAERGDMDIFLLAGRYTLLEQEALDSFLPLCVKRGIGIVIGGAFNSGILATGAVDGAWYNYDPAPADILERVRRIEAVCQRHNVALKEAALQFPLAHPAVVSLIPGAKSKAEAMSATELVKAETPTALWGELKSEGLLRDDAPAPGDGE